MRESITARLDDRVAVGPVDAATGEQLTALRGELSKVGSNLNQVARALNWKAKGGLAQVDRRTALKVIKATKIEFGHVRDQLSGRVGR